MDKIGIVGVGVVGGALADFYRTFGYDLKTFDVRPELNTNTMEEVNGQDIIFICVPTPYHLDGRGFDISYVRDALCHVRADKLVCIKSTIVPGSTEMLQKEFPHLRLMYIPEFLIAAKAIECTFHPDRTIVGYTRKSENEVGRILMKLPSAPHEAAMPATEAELIKYFGNTFLAMKVVYAEQMYDLCQALGADYSRVISMVDSRIGDTHLCVGADGYRGYGGTCFPKDTRALIQRARELGIDMSLLREVEAINDVLRGGKKE